ncbi:MAG: DUF2236 domain-containing protein [Chitinophagales bacterium]|nr:DUF2236 domain-containing protein [Chitinophagales bacterium]
MKITNPYWARKRIAQLNTETDFQEINHLAFEVRYATPIFTHSLFSVAFARQAAVPSIAEVLYRGGKGGIITNARKRNNDTLLFFGEFFKHGNSEEGKKIAEQLNRIHAHFPITNEQNLYTLATLMCEPIRMSKFLTGRNLFNEKETRAVFLFWKMIGGMLHIHNFPADEHKAMSFYETFEKENFAYTEAGRQVVESLADEFATRWYPKWMKQWGRSVYFALFDDWLLNTFRLPKPPALLTLSVRWYLWFYLMVWVQLLPDPDERSIVDTFKEDYEGYHIRKVGTTQSDLGQTKQG